MNCRITIPLCVVVVVLAGLLVPLSSFGQTIQIDLNRSTTAIENTTQASVFDVIHGRVVLSGFPTMTGFNIQVNGSPHGCMLHAAISKGDTVDVPQDISNPDLDFFGAAVFVTFNQLNATDPVTLFNFDIQVGVLPMTLCFTLGENFGVANESFETTLVKDFDSAECATITEGAVVTPPTETPTDTPVVVTPTNTETPFTPTTTPVLPTPTNTETPFTPTNSPVPPPATETETPGPTPTPTEPPTGALIALDGFFGIHASGITVNLAAFAPGPEPYYFPWNIARDASLTADGKGVYALEATGHVYTYSLGDNSLAQIPNESQFYFANEDVAVAVRPAGTGSDSAQILIDNGHILPIGNAPNIEDVFPPLPYRDGTMVDPDGDPADRELVVPGPLEGPLNIGTIAATGGWNVGSAVDFALVNETSALVLARSGLLYKVGDTQPAFEISPYFGVDIARRIEYAKVGDVDYCVILDGLGGVHLAGPAESVLRTNWNTNVLST